MLIYQLNDILHNVSRITYTDINNIVTIAKEKKKSQTTVSLLSFSHKKNNKEQ